MAAGRDVSLRDAPRHDPGADLHLRTSGLEPDIPARRLGAERGEYKKARNWIITSFVLGAAFLGNQAYEWKTLPFRAHTNAYGSLFYIMSGLHGLHVLLGLVAMIALLGRLAGSMKGGDPGETAVFQAVSYYWHFVDFVWIGLFSALFLLS